MQTFLPYPDFSECAKVLDNKRLGKQRVEAYQILKALSDANYGWQNHPAVKMWNGYSNCLAEYGIAICREWKRRGFQDTLYPKFHTIARYVSGRYKTPDWLGNDQLHSSHRANLLRKNPEHYSQFGWTEEPQEGYYWPV